MSVLKVIELLSSSSNSWEEATQKAITKASKSLKNIRSVNAQNQSASVSDSKISEYRVTLKVTFKLE